MPSSQQAIANTFTATPTQWQLSEDRHDKYAVLCSECCAGAFSGMPSPALFLGTSKDWLHKASNQSFALLGNGEAPAESRGNHHDRCSAGGEVFMMS